VKSGPLPSEMGPGRSVKSGPLSSETRPTQNDQRTFASKSRPEFGLDSFLYVPHLHDSSREAVPDLGHVVERALGEIVISGMDDCSVRQPG